VSAVIDEYLESIRHNLRLETTDEKEVIDELSDHIEDRVQELKENGLHDEEAVNTCIGLLGSAKSVAHQNLRSPQPGKLATGTNGFTPPFTFCSTFYTQLVERHRLGARPAGWLF